MISFIRHASSVLKRPALIEVLPAKRTLQKMLFDYDSRLNYRKYLPVITKIYDNLDSNELIEVPGSFKGSDLLLFREVLKEIRVKTHTINRHLLKLENELIEYSAELGDNNAVLILAFDCLKNADANTKEDVEHAKYLIKELHGLKHPLTLKLTGDLAYLGQHLDSAIKSYNDFLALENDTVLAGEVYQNLGLIHFQLQRLVVLEQNFQKLIKLTTLDKLSNSYFHLGLIYEDDPKLSRYYYEMSASQGLIESFPSLGFLELNCFNDAHKLIEWFKLGVELGDFNCMIGLFDSFMQIEDYASASKMLDNIHVVIENRKPMSEQDFEAIRGEKIKELNAKVSKISQSQDRWNLS